MKQWIERGDQWFSGRQRREQVIIAVLSVGLILWLGFVAVIEPAQIAKEQSERQLRQVSTSVQQLESQLIELRERASRDPNAPLSTRERQLERRYSQVQERVEQLAVFIHPDELLSWVQVLLESEDGLALVAFDAKAPELFMEDSDGNMASVYRHEVSMTVRGGYFQVRNYVDRLQQARFQFYWREMNYQVVDYPTAEATMRLYVLSQEGRD